MTDCHRSDRSEYAGSTFSRPAQHNHEEINRARQAAEALFAPKPRIIEPSAPTADQSPRKPRILSAEQVRPTCVQPTEAPVDPVPPKPTRKIPASHLGRIAIAAEVRDTRAVADQKVAFGKPVFERSQRGFETVAMVGSNDGIDGDGRRFSSPRRTP